ncbi:MAG: response regulator transcription factor [Bacteroidota bacterium]
MSLVKIILADDHKLILDGLKLLLADNADFKIIAEAENGKELIEKTRLVNPDLIITDIDMPIMTGLEAVKILRKEFGSLKILVLSMHKDQSMFLKLKEAGANGYIHKNCDKEELFFAINQLLKGKEYISSEIQDSENTYKIENSVTEIELTKREIEILVHITEGLTNIEIGKKLFISDRTVDTHRTNLMKKINVNNVAGLIRFAYQNKFVV